MTRVFNLRMESFSAKRITGLEIIYFALSFVYFIVSCLHPMSSTTEELARFWGVGILAQFITFLIIFYSKHRTLNVPYLYFLFGAFVCWFGQLFVIMLGLRTDTEPIVTGFEPAALYITLQYSALSFFILTTLALFKVKKGVVHIQRDAKINQVFMSSISLAGLSLIALGAYAFISTLISNLISSMKYGYASIYINDGSPDPISNILSNFSLFFIPGLFMTLVANKKNQRIRAPIIILLLMIITISLATGSRSSAIALVLAIFWLYSHEFSSFGKAKSALVIALGIIFIRVLNAIAEYRVLAVGGLEKFVDLMINGKTGGGSSVGNMLNEFGFNIFSLHHTIGLIPSQQDFAYGYTYFASVMAIIPSFFFGGYSFSKDAALAPWLQQMMGMNYGPGYSIVAESYYNFGWFGLGAILALGILLIKMFSNEAKESGHAILRNAFIAVMIYASLFIARGTSLLLLRDYFYMVVLPGALVMTIYSIRKYKMRGKLS